MSSFPATRIRPQLAHDRAVRVTSPAPREAWREVLAADPNALVFHSPAWLDFVCNAASYEDASRLYELSDGRRLVLPIVRQEHCRADSRTRPKIPLAWGTGGIIAAGGVRPTDAAAAVADLAGRNVVRTTLRPNPLDAPAWDAARPAGAVVIRAWLTSCRSKEASTACGGSASRATRGGPSRRPTARASDDRDTSGRLIPVYYDLFARSLDRWAAQQHEPRMLARMRGYHRDPKRKFVQMARTFGESFRVWVAWADDRPAAAILVLRGSNAATHYMRGAMDKRVAGPTQGELPVDGSRSRKRAPTAGAGMTWGNRALRSHWQGSRPSSALVHMCMPISTSSGCP